MALRTPPLYLQAGSHSAENDRLGIRGMVGTEGVGAQTAELQVTQSGTPAMTVSVAVGHGWVNGTTSTTQGTYKTYNDAPVTLTITTANATLPRIDKVCLTIRDAAYAGASNDCILQVIAGTAAASPTAPATPASSLVLATVAVAAAATTIVNANITDTRTRAQMGLPLSTSAVAQLSGIPQASVTNLVSDLAAKSDTAPAINAQTGTTYTFVLADATAGKTITASNAAASTYTVPPQSSVTFVAGALLLVTNLGAGVVTFAGGVGVTVTNAAATLSQYQTATLVRTASDAWTVIRQGAASPGMELVATATATASSSVSINNCFTSTYEYYRIMLYLTSSVGATLNMRLRLSGTDNSAASSYLLQRMSANATSVTGAQATSAEWAGPSIDSTGKGASSIDLFGPAVADVTNILMKSHQYIGSNLSFTGRHNVLTAFDGFTIYPASGTITSTANGIKVYGYRNV